MRPSSPPLEGDYEGSSPGEEEASSSGEEENLSDNVESCSEAEEERRSSNDSMGEQSIQGGEVESDNESDEEDQQLDQPVSFYYGPENYKKSCKIGTRCSISKVLENLENTLGEMEMEWFTEQNQFSHMFHMPRERNQVEKRMLRSSKYHKSPYTEGKNKNKEEKKEKEKEKKNKGKKKVKKNKKQKLV